jgi:hypothetical protein
VSFSDGGLSQIYSCVYKVIGITVVVAPQTSSNLKPIWKELLTSQLPDLHHRFIMVQLCKQVLATAAVLAVVHAHPWGYIIIR